VNLGDQSPNITTHRFSRVPHAFSVNNFPSIHEIRLVVNEELTKDLKNAISSFLVDVTGEESGEGSCSPVQLSSSLWPSTKSPVSFDGHRN
jgi:hypothetical protein